MVIPYRGGQSLRLEIRDSSLKILDQLNYFNLHHVSSNREHVATNKVHLPNLIMPRIHGVKTMSNDVFCDPVYSRQVEVSQ